MVWEDRGDRTHWINNQAPPSFNDCGMWEFRTFNQSMVRFLIIYYEMVKYKFIHTLDQYVITLLANELIFMHQFKYDWIKNWGKKFCLLDMRNPHNSSSYKKMDRISTGDHFHHNSLSFFFFISLNDKNRSLSGIFSALCWVSQMALTLLHYICRLVAACMSQQGFSLHDSVLLFLHFGHHEQKMGREYTDGNLKCVSINWILEVRTKEKIRRQRD